MAAPRSPLRYRAPARALHWIVAFLVFVQIGLGFLQEQEKNREASLAILHQHYRIGVLILALMILRATYRLYAGAPAPIADEPPSRRRIAAMTHFALYALLLSMPFSGYVIWSFMDAPMSLFGGVALPDLFPVMPEDERPRAIAWYVHHYSAWALIALIALHIGAALYHEMFLRNRLIRRRML